MAEIKIEKKRPIWPWILLILVILGVIAYFVYQNQKNDYYNDDLNSEQYNDSTDNDLRGGVPYNPDASDGYGNASNEMAEYEASIKDSIRIITDSTYAKTVFVNLAKATVMKANENNIESSQALEALKNYSDQMNNTDTSEGMQTMGVSESLKSTCDNVVQVLETIQAKNFPSLGSQVSDLKQISNNINSKTSMANQRKNILSFFQKAKNVLNAMNP